MLPADLLHRHSGPLYFRIATICRSEIASSCPSSPRETDSTKLKSARLQGNSWMRMARQAAGSFWRRQLHQVKSSVFRRHSRRVSNHSPAAFLKRTLDKKSVRTRHSHAPGMRPRGERRHRSQRIVAADLRLELHVEFEADGAWPNVKGFGNALPSRKTHVAISGTEYGPLVPKVIGKKRDAKTLGFHSQA